jgi:hypothetical protein
MQLASTYNMESDKYKNEKIYTGWCKKITSLTTKINDSVDLSETYLSAQNTPDSIQLIFAKKNIFHVKR